jgi:hypothetical protein
MCPHCCFLNVICIQEKPWRDLLGQLHHFQCLWALPGEESQSQSQPIISMLSRIEELRFIHVASSPVLVAASSTHQRCEHEVLYFCLPRFELSFELRPGAKWIYSQNRKGYCVAGEKILRQALSCVGNELQERAPLPLPVLFSNFIVLVTKVPNMPVKVLLPDDLVRPGSVEPPHKLQFRHERVTTCTTIPIRETWRHLMCYPSCPLHHMAVQCQLWAWG